MATAEVALTYILELGSYKLQKSQLRPWYLFSQIVYFNP